MEKTMRAMPAATAAALLAGLFAMGGCMSSVKPAAGDTAQTEIDRGALAQATIAEWSDGSALAARRLMERYGVPDEVHYGRLVWRKNWPWERTIVRDIRPPYEDANDVGVIEQVAPYSLTPEQADLAHGFDPSVAYDERHGELSARSDAEEKNFLRLNLAVDVAGGRYTAEQARGEYTRILALSVSGKTSAYMTRLLFLR